RAGEGRGRRRAVAGLRLRGQRVGLARVGGRRPGGQGRGVQQLGGAGVRPGPQAGLGCRPAQPRPRPAPRPRNRPGRATQVNARRAVTPWVSRCLRPGVTDPMAPAPPTRRKGTRLMSTRREFVQGLAAAVGSPLLVNGTAAQPPAPSTGPDVGSLFPFIRSQAVKTDFPLSFLDKSFTDLAGWKRQARGKLQELLHYAPPACDPRPEVVERADRGDHVCERVLFNTTPDVRVPAYVLVPKKADRPLPAVVALHDHGGFYLWGKEKL